MNDLEALAEIRRDVERDLAAAEGQPMDGRVMATWMGSTGGLIAALSAILERNLFGGALVVGPDDVLVVRLPLDCAEADVALVSGIMDERGLTDRYLVVHGDIAFAKIQRAAPIAAQYAEGRVHLVGAPAYDVTDPAFDDHDMEGCQDPDCTETHYP